MGLIGGGGVGGATTKTVSSGGGRSCPAPGTASSLGRSGTITPATPAWAASAENFLGSYASTGLMYVINTTGTPSAATALATSRAPDTVIPCSSATWPARWITGPSARGSE